MRSVGLILFFAAFFAAPPVMAQSTGTILVETSPIPKIRIIRPAEPSAATAALETADTNARQTALTQPSDGAATPPAPRVVRPQSGDDETQARVEPSRPGDGSWQEERDKRFKSAPEAALGDRQKKKKTAKLGPQAIVPIRTPRTTLKKGARIRQLDKMTGQIQTFDIAVGETIRVARLQIRLDACRAPKGNDVFGTMAFLKVWDSKRKSPEPDFTGWMFAESPALSALDHPRYDLWVISCTTPLGE